MSAGYIYVLVNSSMPGLVKVGKTTRLPRERADELSGVTGVPTPFIVAFDQHFADCDAAEVFVHTKLSEKGYRLSEAREFFQAQASEVIRIIASIGLNEFQVADKNQELLPDIVDDEFSSFRLQSSQPSKPWDELIEEAERHYFGLEGYFQDYSEALAAYKSAAKLGSALAYEKIAEMYQNGEGVREDISTAISFYKQGAKLGNYYCYAKLAHIFCSEGSMDNAKKAFEKFISGAEAVDWNSEYEELRNKKYYAMGDILVTSAMLHTEIPGEQPPSFWYYEICRKYIDEIIAVTETDIQNGQIQNIDVLLNYLNIKLGTLKHMRNWHKGRTRASYD